MRWLLQEGPDAKKHKQRAHPVVTFVIHYTVLITTTFYAHDVLVERASRSLQEDCTISEELLKRRQWVGPVLGLYFCMYFAIRLALQWNSKPYLFNVVFYESTFMCSATIVCSALSFCFHRPLISQAFCITVGIDQLLWYFDILGYIFMGKFPIGVCKYLFKPGTNWLGRISSSHHLWTIPLVMWVNGSIFHWLAIPLSFVVVPVSVFISHTMIPVAIRTKQDDDRDVYLNINLSHEMWADVKLRIFKIGEKTFPYVFRLVCWWYILSSLTFGILYSISKVVSSGSIPSIC
mmetsp:Transcript_412/g.891  ORF Transcript_412/g.891 Transcript_412/m.891 type:complete len:291 (-) Transcript_412:89-961(-)